jgi:hypothetical protein
MQFSSLSCVSNASPFSYRHYSISVVVVVVVVVTITVTAVPKAWSLGASKSITLIAATCRRNGRPGSQAVSEKFSVDWGTYMSSHNDIVYIKLDVRGARGQGSRSLYRHLGGVEVQDQITVLRSVVKLQRHCPRMLTGTISSKPIVDKYILFKPETFRSAEFSRRMTYFDSLSWKCLWQFSAIAYCLPRLLWSFVHCLHEKYVYNSKAGYASVFG